MDESAVTAVTTVTGVTTVIPSWMVAVTAAGDGDGGDDRVAMPDRQLSQASTEAGLEPYRADVAFVVTS
jgi:hypothetical protein